MTAGSDGLRQGPDRRYLGHRANRAFYIVIGALVLVILAMILLQVLVVDSLHRQQRHLQTELAYTQGELAHYKEAYRTVLADAQAFGRIYDTNYTGDANATAAAAPAPVAPQMEVQHLPARSTWDFYKAQGTIDDSCIPTTKVVQTPEDTVEIVLVASGKAGEEPPKVALLVDATTLATFSIGPDQGVYKAAVVLPKGTHHIDIAYLNPGQSHSVTISLIRIGDRTVENEVSVLDYGTGFTMLDCKETEQGDTLAENGAMRFRIEKV